MNHNEKCEHFPDTFLFAFKTVELVRERETVLLQIVQILHAGMPRNHFRSRSGSN